MQKVDNTKVIDCFSINRPYLISTDSELIFISIKAPITFMDDSVFTNTLLDKEQRVIHNIQGSQELTVFLKDFTNPTVVLIVERN